MTDLIIQRDFDPKVAEELDTDCAIILENIVYWVGQNKIRGTNFFENKYWTFNSVKAFQDFFPYLTEKQIRVRLDKLEETGYIILGNFNKVKYDRTSWYTLGDKYTHRVSHLPNGQMDLPKRANGSDQKGEPIPNDKPNYKPISNLRTNNNQNLTSEELLEIRANKKPKSPFGFSMPKFTSFEKKPKKYIYAEGVK